jgi:hypothetical protein
MFLLQIGRGREMLMGLMHSLPILLIGRSTDSKWTTTLAENTPAESCLLDDGLFSPSPTVSYLLATLVHPLGSFFRYGLILSYLSDML